MAHVAGSLVLMSDYSWKDNSKIEKGDKVLGADLLPATVVNVTPVRLANRRMLSLQENPAVRFHEVDLLWARENQIQWWWIENAFMAQQEWINSGAGLKVIDSPLVSYNVEFATLNGFEKQTIIDVSEEYNFYSTMPYFKTDRCCPVIINGQVVSSGTNEYVYDYTKFDWLKYSDQLNLILNSKKNNICLLKN